MRHQSFSFILSHPRHPGNIGAVARAMNVMGFTKLLIIGDHETRDKILHPESIAMSTHGTAVLEQAIIFPTLKQALHHENFNHVIATLLANDDTIGSINPTNFGDQVRHATPETKYAVVFGNERTGLSNEEIECCNASLHIPVGELHPRST